MRYCNLHDKWPRMEVTLPLARFLTYDSPQPLRRPPPTTTRLSPCSPPCMLPMVPPTHSIPSWDQTRVDQINRAAIQTTSLKVGQLSNWPIQSIVRSSGIFSHPQPSCLQTTTIGTSRICTTMLSFAPAWAPMHFQCPYCRPRQYSHEGCWCPHLAPARHRC